MKRIKVLLLLLSVVLTASAKPITKATRQKALHLMHLQESARFDEVVLPSHLSQNIRAFNAQDNKGYLVVGEDANGGQVVLGYSNEGSLDYTLMPEAMKYCLELMGESLRNGGADVKEDIPCHKRKAALATSVAPLLGTIAWGQEYPFNEKCPKKTDGTHYYVGCVATAATQIMRYHQWPASYDWANMPSVAPSSGASSSVINACATLAADFGSAVNMEYLADGSAASSMMVPQALRGFGYQSGVRVHRRDFYSTSEWLAVIREELSESRPVYYGAASDVGNSGHAFVCDGYDEDGYFHINWGWYGTSNGNFLLNHLDPSSLGAGGGTGGYNRDQEIVTGISATPVGAEQEWPVYGTTKLTCNNYGSEATFMTFIENFETIDYEGNVAVVVMRGDEILKVLHSEPLSIKAFNNNVSGYVMMYLRNVPIGSIDAADGPCQVRLATKANGTSEWIPLRHAIGSSAYVSATISGKNLVLGEVSIPQPDVKLMEKITLNGPAYEGGALSLSTRINNLSRDYRLKNIVVQLKNTDTQEVFTMENETSIYDESVEPITLVSALPSGVKAGTYDVTLYEKGFASLMFDDEEVGRLQIEIKDNPGHSVMRLTQRPEWGTLSGADAIVQGDGVSFVTEVRNYGPDGTTAMQCWLQSASDASKEYIFLQQNVTAKAGEKANATFYRKLPVDAGQYRLVFKYLNADGTIDEDDTAYTGGLITVEEPTENVMLEAVAVDMPEELVIGQRYACSITVKAVNQNFSGTLYVRLRQFTNSGGELAYMGSQSIPVGTSKTISFNYKPAVTANKYMMLTECKMGTKEGVVLGYDNCYGIYNVVTEPTGIRNPVLNTTEGTLSPDAPRYNLNGQRVGNDYRGIVVQEGRKVLVK